MYETTKDFETGGKFSWFDYHRCFLPRNHSFTRNRTVFRKCRIVIGGSPCRIFGKELYPEVKDYPMVTIKGNFVIPYLRKMSISGRIRAYSRSCLFGNTNCFTIIWM